MTEGVVWGVASGALLGGVVVALALSWLVRSRTARNMSAPGRGHVRLTAATASSGGIVALWAGYLAPYPMCGARWIRRWCPPLWGPSW